MRWYVFSISEIDLRYILCENYRSIQKERPKQSPLYLNKYRKIFVRMNQTFTKENFYSTFITTALTFFREWTSCRTIVIYRIFDLHFHKILNISKKPLLLLGNIIIIYCITIFDIKNLKQSFSEGKCCTHGAECHSNW